MVNDCEWWLMVLNHFFFRTTYGSWWSIRLEKASQMTMIEPPRRPTTFSPPSTPRLSQIQVLHPSSSSSTWELGDQGGWLVGWVGWLAYMLTGWSSYIRGVWEVDLRFQTATHHSVSDSRLFCWPLRTARFASSLLLAACNLRVFWKELSKDVHNFGNQECFHMFPPRTLSW